AIAGPDGESLGKGLAGYETAEAQAIQGCQSREIEGILGYPGRAALIHRDDMVL
ncbi:MAG: glutamate 5-kinase, partial [Paracoccaceae bacterium]